MASQKKRRPDATDAEVEALAEQLYQQLVSQEVLSLKTSDQFLWTRVLQTSEGRFFCQLLSYDAQKNRYKWIWTYDQVDTLQQAESTARLWIDNYERDLLSGNLLSNKKI